MLLLELLVCPFLFCAAISPFHIFVISCVNQRFWLSLRKQKQKLSCSLCCWFKGCLLLHHPIQTRLLCFAVCIPFNLSTHGLYAPCTCYMKRPTIIHSTVCTILYTQLSIIWCISYGAHVFAIAKRNISHFGSGAFLSVQIRQRSD